MMGILLIMLQQDSKEQVLQNTKAIHQFSQEPLLTSDIPIILVNATYLVTVCETFLVLKRYLC